MLGSGVAGFYLWQIPNNCRWAPQFTNRGLCWCHVLKHHLHQVFKVPCRESDPWNLTYFKPLGGNTYMFDLLRLPTSARLLKAERCCNSKGHLLFKWLQQSPNLPDYWELRTCLYTYFFKVKLLSGYCSTRQGECQLRRLDCRYWVKSTPPPPRHERWFFAQTDHGFLEGLQRQKAIQSRRPPATVWPFTRWIGNFQKSKEAAGSQHWEHEQGNKAAATVVMYVRDRTPGSGQITNQNKPGHQAETDLEAQVPGRV